MTTKTKLLAASIAALVLLTMVGCGGDGKDNAEATTPATTGAIEASTATTNPTSSDTAPSDASAGGDPCRLLTSTEAENALGRAVGAPVSLVLGLSPQTGNGYDCAYHSVNQDAGPASVHAGLLGDQVPRDAWEQAERAQPDLQEVTDLGELAFFDENKQSIDVFDQGRWVQVQMINSTRHSELLTLLTDLARNALERI
jgi:hypothetical protein